MATLYHTNGKTEEVFPLNGKSFTLDELQRYVKGYIEHLSCKNGMHLFLNEEGKLEGMDINLNATDFAYKHTYLPKSDFIVGPAIMVTSLEAGEEEEGNVG